MRDAKCFVCSKKLDRDEYKDDPHVIDPLYGGLWFRSSGNFGSTVFDPLPVNGAHGEFLQVAICDECLVSKKDEITYIFDVHSKTTSRSKPWNPEEDHGIGH